MAALSIAVEGKVEPGALEGGPVSPAQPPAPVPNPDLQPVLARTVEPDDEMRRLQLYLVEWIADLES